MVSVMRFPKETYIEYKKERDILFVFGAGASIAEGTPLQKDILKLIFESDDDELTTSDTANEVRRFISENFHISESEYPTLEAVFGYFEYFISKREGLGKKYSTTRIIELKEAFIKIVHYVISNTKGNKDSTYRKFWKVISEVNRNISVVSMNYDTLLDEAFDYLYPDKAYIDYCIELMNYHHYDKIDAFHWWVNPREPVPVWTECDPKPIKLIKVHGSLNWKYCNCCNQVLLTAWDTKIDLSSMGFKGYIHASRENSEIVAFDLVCPLDGNTFDTLIVPPSHIKELSHPAINKLFDEAAIEIRKANKVVFVGYSFPEADVHIKALFRKNLRADTEVHIVDPYLNNTIKMSYKCLSVNPVFHEQTFDQFVTDHLNKLLYSPKKKMQLTVEGGH